jgi:hypothetical protein
MRVEDFINQNRDKIVDVHWNETIQQYVKNLSLSQVLLNNLKKEEYFNSFSNFFENINNEIENYIKDVKNPTYQIAIVGAIKAGKSTLINALIGEDLASVSVTPETATLTKFRYSEKNYVKIKFYTKNKWEKIWQNASQKKATKFINEYKKLNAESIKINLLGRNEERKEFLNINELKIEIEKWTSSQSKEHYFVEEIEIGINTLKLPSQVCLVDTPGLNDIVDYRSKITRDYIDSANAVLVCINAKTLRNEEVLTLAQVFSKARYKKDQIYVLGTQIDILNSLEDWKKQKRDWIETLKEKEFFETEKKAEEHILGVSSLTYPIGEKLSSDNFDDLVDDIPQIMLKVSEAVKIAKEEDQNKKIKKIEEIKNKLIKNSNIRNLKNIISENLLKDFNEKQLKDFFERYIALKEEIRKFREENYKVVSSKKKEFELNSIELEEKIRFEKERIKKLEETNNRINNKIQEIGEEFRKNFSGMENAFKELKEKIEKMDIE